MDLKYHFVASTLLTLIFLPFVGLKAFLIVVGGFLIDVDHYIWFVLKFKNLSLKDSYKFYKSGHTGYTGLLHIFHTLEFGTILIILSLFSIYAALILAGYALHMVMDYLYLFILKPDYKKCRVISIYHWLKNQSPKNSTK